jgi:hypothetical protein
MDKKKSRLRSWPRIFYFCIAGVGGVFLVPFTLHLEGLWNRRTDSLPLKHSLR